MLRMCVRMNVNYVMYSKRVCYVHNVSWSKRARKNAILANYTHLSTNSRVKIKPTAAIANDVG